MRTIYSCAEFQEVNVPIAELVEDDRLNVYPAVLGRGFFDIDLRQGRLVVTAKSFIGLIPLNDRVALHVAPRFPIKNLFYVIARSDLSGRFLPGLGRGYELTPAPDFGAVRVFTERILEILGTASREGLLRKYLPRETSSHMSGELMISETVSRYRSAGIKHKYVWRSYDLSESTEENRLVKSALQKVASYYSNNQDADSESLRRAIEALMPIFSRVELGSAGLNQRRISIGRMIADLPSGKKWYAGLLWLSYLINGNKGVKIESLGAASFDTMVIDMAVVFESFVRNVVSTKIHQIGDDLVLRDGNRFPLPLFMDRNEHTVHPDLYLLRRGKPIVVIDAKYKPAFKASDRYEVLAFCDALRVRLAILLAPQIPGTCRKKYLGITPSGIRLVELRINLGAEDLVEEENTFLSELKNLLLE